MVLKAFTELTEPLEVQYTPDGKVYRIPPVSIEVGVKIVDVQANPEEYIDRPGTWFASLVLGPLWDELDADRAPGSFRDRILLTALAEWNAGRDAAERMWEQGVDPKALAALRDKVLADIKAQAEAMKRPASKRSPRTGAAAKTP